MLLFLLAVAGVIVAVDLVLAGLYAWNLDLPRELRQLGPAARLHAGAELGLRHRARRHGRR